MWWVQVRSRITVCARDRVSACVCWNENACVCVCKISATLCVNVHLGSSIWNRFLLTFLIFCCQFTLPIILSFVVARNECTPPNLILTSLFHYQHPIFRNSTHGIIRKFLVFRRHQLLLWTMKFCNGLKSLFKCFMYECVHVIYLILLSMIKGRRKRGKSTKR